jgi:hypothetical protein
MKNPLDKLKKKKTEETENESNNTDSKDSSASSSDDKRRSVERRNAFNEKPIREYDSDSDSNDIKFKHLIETELNVIQKKAKALSLNTEEGFDEKSGENYWRVSVNEFLGYVNQRSKIIIEQLSSDSHPVNISISDEEGSED